MCVGVYMCENVCVSGSRSLNLGHEIHRDAFENKGNILWETECVLKFCGLPETIQYSLMVKSSASGIRKNRVQVPIFPLHL